jgi:signal transduction histidine kinase
MRAAVSSLSSVARLVLDQAPACHWALNRDRVFVEFLGNGALFGCPADQLLGRSLREVLPLSSHQLWEDRIGQVFNGESFCSTELVGDYGGEFAVHLFPLPGANCDVSHAGGFALDVTQSQIVERELRANLLKVLQAQETEQSRVSRFLHDEVGQSLTAAGIRLDLLRMDFENRLPEIGERTQAIQELLEGVMSRIRDLSYELNPAIVERAGLQSALDRLAGRSRRTFTGTLRFMSDSSLRLPPKVGSAIYRIAQEAIQNAIRHAACSHIGLLVKTTQAGPALEVSDDGCGFETTAGVRGRRGLGLLLMEYYAAQAGLRLDVISHRGKGTLVRAVYDQTAAD